MRDRTMPWSVRLADLCPVDGKPDPMCPDPWRHVAGVPSVFEEEKS